MRKKVILVGVSHKQAFFEYSMEELENLAHANYYEVTAVMVQNMEQINRATYVGKGKVLEIKQQAEITGAQLIIFNDELSPSQISNLEAELAFPIMDRTGLILAIFADRAKTREAQIQVEIARLQYELPRIFGQGEEMDQQGGGFGVTNRGSGETKLELNRRTIRYQIKMLRRELETIESNREVMRRRRKKNSVPVVSLVGYTNAGKSTTMNGLIKLFQGRENKTVMEKDMLFATLETSVREMELPGHKQFLLTDTVGFVSKLPHHLVEAFRSTLEEAREADLLIHVVDYSDPHYKQMMETTEQTLLELGVTKIPVIYAYNKADKREDIEYPIERGDTIVFSAREEDGLQLLANRIKKELFANYETATFLIPFEDGKWTAYLNEVGAVSATEYVEKGTKITAEVAPKVIEQLKEYQV